LSKKQATAGTSRRDEFVATNPSFTSGEDERTPGTMSFSIIVKDAASAKGRVEQTLYNKCLVKK
jgi:hypothetical protein